MKRPLHVLIAYEWRSITQRKRDPMLVLTFYVLAGLMIALFTEHQANGVTVTTNPAESQLRAVAMIWLLVMFSQILGFDSLFEDEFNSGWLSHAVQQNYALAPWLLTRILIRLVVLGSSLLIVTPLHFIWFPISLQHAPLMMLSLAAALPGVTAIPVLVASLQPRGEARMIRPLLIIPLWMPFMFLSFVTVFSEDQFYAVGLLLALGIAACCAVPLLAARALVSQVTLG